MKRKKMSAAAGRGLLLLAFAASVGCKAKEPPQEPKPVAPAPVVDAPRQEPDVVEDVDAEAAAPPAPVVFDSWPGREELHTFSLTWLGGEEPVVLREEPRPDAEAVAEVQWMPGSEVEWLESRVVVTEPAIYGARKEVTFQGVAYEPEGDEAVGDPVELSLDEGDVVALYQYAGEGTCYVAVGGELFVGMCPGEGFSREGEAGVDSGWAPAEQQWWVQVDAEGRRGWVQVDGTSLEPRTHLMDEYDD